MPGATYLFIGSSITECSRFEPGLGPLGAGYVRTLGDHRLGVDPPLRVVNPGVSGDRTREVVQSWDHGGLDLSLAVVIFAVGVNDTWGHHDAKDPTSAEESGRLYESMLASLISRRTRAIDVMLILLASSRERDKWREDLDPKIEIAGAIATRH